MQTSLDKFGRIIIPHAVREDLGLKPGDPLEISWTGQEIRLKPVFEEEPLMVREGILIYDARTAEAPDEDAVQEDRNRRMRKILGQDRD
jgi:AbrB family looped-hinge helix DNA binding protein